MGIMGIMGISSSFCSLVGSISLLMFAGTALAASVDTKAPAKMISAPVPTVKAPVVSAPAPTVQPKVEIQAPTQSIQPKTSVKVPTQSISRPQPKQIHQAPVQPKVNIQTPTQKVQTLDPRNTPKLAPAPTAPRPGQDLRAPAATPRSPAATNALGGSKIDSQTLGRIQGIQEAATAAQVFKQLEELRNAQDLQNIGAAKRGFGGDQAGPLGDGGIGIGAITGEGSNGSSQPRNQPGMGAIDRSASADPAAGYNSGAFGGSSLGTNKDKGGFTGRQFGRNSNGGIDFKGSYSHDNGSTSTVVISTADDGAGNSRQITSVVTTDANGDITAQRDRVQVTGSDGESRTISDTSTGDTSNSSDSAEAYRAGAASVNRSTGNTEEAGEKKVGQSSEVDQGDGDSCGRRDVMTGKCYDSKPTMQQMTGQKARDGGGEGTSAPIIGPIAVTNEDEFHSGGGGGGGRGVNTDMITQPPTEGAEGGGGIPPAPSGADLDESLGDAAFN